MLEALPPEKLSKLDMRAGEHLAAILTTAFLGTGPSDIDTTGGVDLSFRFPGTDRSQGQVFPAGVTEAAFEVKSLPGPFREWQRGIERDEDRGLDATGRTLPGMFKGANDVLLEAHASVRRAANQLGKKAGAAASKNVFVVVHPFDHMVVECLEYPVIGPLLDPLEEVGALASVWVLWVPDHLTMWSTGDREWVELFFRAASREEVLAREPDRLGVLQEAEGYYLERLAHGGGSPYRFGWSFS
jgi:hypothetical protein